MDPIATAPQAGLSTATAAPASGTSGQPAKPSSKQAFEMALSAALNRANVLADASGTDDDDDGSRLTVGNSMGLRI